MSFRRVETGFDYREEGRTPRFDELDRLIRDGYGDIPGARGVSPNGWSSAVRALRVGFGTPSDISSSIETDIPEFRQRDGKPHEHRWRLNGRDGDGRQRVACRGCGRVRRVGKSITQKRREEIAMRLGEPGASIYRVAAECGASRGMVYRVKKTIERGEF